MKSWTLQVATAALLFAAPKALADSEPVIPPGQEALFADMLGMDADLPAGCKVVRVSIAKSSVHSHYRCRDDASSPGGADVRLALHPVEHRGGGVVKRTDRFAIVAADPVPAALLDALIGRIRTSEARVKLIVTTPERRHAEGTQQGPSAWSYSTRMIGVVVGLLCLVLAVGLLPRRPLRPRSHPMEGPSQTLEVNE